MLFRWPPCDPVRILTMSTIVNVPKETTTATSGCVRRHASPDPARAWRQVLAKHHFHQGPTDQCCDQGPVPRPRVRGIRGSRFGPQRAECVGGHLISLGSPRDRCISRKYKSSAVPTARSNQAPGLMCPPPGSAIVELPILTTTTEPMMRTRQPTTTTLENLCIPVQAKLAAAWTSFMFLYVYVDIIAFFKPGTIDEILVGKIWEFDVSQTLLTVFLALMAIPIFMVVLSMTLPARANRITNLIVASVQVPYAAFNVVGESWTYFYGLGVALEVIVLALILRYAWTWPRTSSPVTLATSLDRESLRTPQQA